jgi:hypothetical protein
MDKWDTENKPPLDVCPKHYCFNWVPPKGKADLSGKVYDSFEDAVAESERMVTFLHGGCAAPFGPCRRGSKNPNDSDCYEPFESVLRKNNLPELFFCDPASLIDEFIEEYEAMAKSLWGPNA